MAKQKRQRGEQTQVSKRPSTEEFLNELLERTDLPVSPDKFRRAVNDVNVFLETAKEIAEANFSRGARPEDVWRIYQELRLNYDAGQALPEMKQAEPEPEDEEAESTPNGAASDS